MKSPLVSIIVPFPKIYPGLFDELLPSLMLQTYRHFEVILVPDIALDLKSFPSFVNIFPLPGGPAKKRDHGARHARGTIFAFIDSDAYPATSMWLQKSISLLSIKNVAAVCGPGITPPSDSIAQIISGEVWGCWLGAGGAGVYRNKPMGERYVDDYPSFNFIVAKSAFESVKGFNTHFWPGEDTKLCHELVYHLNRKILYNPELVVYHHRRPLFSAHLKQVARFGLHRGFFAKIFPKTSRRIGYYVPLIFSLELIILPLFFSYSLIINLYLFVNVFYCVLVFLTVWPFFIKYKSIRFSLQFGIAIFLTHIIYGLSFLKGLVQFRLDE